MKRLILAAAVAAAALNTAACASFPGSNSAGEAVLKDLQGCERHYQGAIGAGVNGSFKIDCLPAAAPPPS